MAGIPSGITPTPHRRILRLVPNTTRTRRCHGVFIAGNDLAVVYSTRRIPHAVLLELGHGDAPRLSHGMNPAQARSMARALNAAAGAVESASAVRPLQPCRWGHDADITCPDCTEREANQHAQRDVGALLDVARRVEAMLTRQRWRADGSDPEAVLLRDARAAIASASQEVRHG